MNEKDFPALYQLADTQSGRSQRWFMASFAANLFCIIVSAILSTLNIADKNFAIFQSAILLIGLFLTAYLATAKPQAVWYSARALAESVKTMTWRYMMRAEPYDTSDADARSHFLTNLRKLLEANKKVASTSRPNLAKDEITFKMDEVRHLGLDERKAFYRNSRIDDQKSWYLSKSIFNRYRSFLWFSVVIIAYAAAIGFTIARPAYPQTDFWPTDALLTIASSLLAWNQTKRYQELSASYALTGREINLLDAEFPPGNDEGVFSSYVGDAENAFSREHTQWQARRDAA